MKKYIKPDAEIVKFDIVDVITADPNSGVFDGGINFGNNVVDEGVYVEPDGYMVPVVE